MIDIHCHILPAIDDGPKQLADSLLMCRQAVEQGYTDIIATPHHLKGKHINPGSVVQAQVTQLNVILQSMQIPLTVHPGQEIRITEDLLERLERGDAIPLANSTYVLIELPSSFIPLYSLALSAKLLHAGYQPIIAHPERNRLIKEQPDKLRPFIEMGVCTQLTWQSLSLSSHFKKISKKLIREDWIHFIATDAHDTFHRPLKTDKIKRWLSPQLKRTIETYQAKALEVLK